MDVLFRAAGIDPVQWRALTRTYLVMDVRRSAGVQSGTKGKPKGSEGPRVYTGLVVISLMNSAIIAVLVMILRDPFTAALGLVTMASLNTSMLLLVDFT